VIKEIAKSLRARNLKIKEVSSETLILSFIYSRDISGTKCYDPYFGKLAEYLTEKTSVLTLFRPLGCDLKLNKSKSKNSYSVYNFLKLEDWFSIVMNYLSLCRVAFIKVSSEDKNIKTLLVNELFNPSSVISLIYYELGKKISTNKNIKRIIYTFENNSWEQAFLLGLNGNAKTIGYIHTIIPECAANMFISKEEATKTPLPDKVLTLGTIPKTLIDIYSEASFSVETSCALRFEYLYNDKNTGTNIYKPKGNKVLVGLEGVMESVKVLDLCLDAASLFPEKNFVIRCHPALGIEILREHLKFPKLISTLANIEVSVNKSLQEDINSSSCMIYWGSTVGVEALFKGLPVIHVDLGAELSYDPLFFWNELAYTVKTAPDLVDAIRNIENIDENEYVQCIEKIDDLKKLYFSKVTPNSIDKFLQ
jgi:hypothetical protein